MSDFERKKIELELKAFTSKNFEKPSECKNLAQIRFYVSELSQKITDLYTSVGYVPEWAYVLLAQYNSAQNKFLSKEFQNTYCKA